MMTDLLSQPCYVLGIESQIGLSLVRELGEAGVPVIGIALSPDAIGLRSRFLHAKALLHAPRTAEGLQELRALGERHGAGYLLTVSEANTGWLIDHLGELGNLKALVPSSQAFEAVLDKEKTLALARKVGVDVPQSVCPQSWDEVEATAAIFPFPAVLKWADPNAVAPQLEACGLECVKAEYVDNATEFLAVAQRYRSLNTWPLLQEYCPGVGLGQFFFMHRGEAVRRFQHVRVAEWPPEGGFSSVCDALPLSQFVEQQERSIALLKEIGWEGVAMVEYRYDSASGRAVLMEINGRYWGSFPLAMHSGTGFSLLSYALQGQGRMPALPAQRDDIRCRMVATELKRLVRIVVQPGKIMDKRFQVRPLYELFRFAIDYFRPSVRYYVWRWDDPKPFFQDVMNALGMGKKS